MRLTITIAITMVNATIPITTFLIIREMHGVIFGWTRAQTECTKMSKEIINETPIKVKKKEKERVINHTAVEQKRQMIGSVYVCSKSIVLRSASVRPALRPVFLSTNSTLVSNALISSGLIRFSGSTVRPLTYHTLSKHYRQLLDAFTQAIKSVAR
jgi:hypothetical protein